MLLNKMLSKIQIKLLLLSPRHKGIVHAFQLDSDSVNISGICEVKKNK